jgi:hypothetical protein
MTQPRIDTTMLIDAVEAVIGVSGGELHKLLVAVAGRLAEQEEAFRNLEISFGKMTEMAVKDGDTIREQEATIRHLRVELCKASAVAMEHAEAVKIFQDCRAGNKPTTTPEEISKAEWMELAR